MTDLFDYARARARASDPDTSHEAAAIVDPSRLMRQIHACLMRYGWKTSGEIGQILGEPRDSVSPRMKDMERLGLVFRAGKTTTKPRCILWGAL